MSNVSKSSAGKVYLSGNDRLTVEQRREVKRNVETARTFQHNRRIKAHRAEVLNQIQSDGLSSSKQYDPAQSISGKSHRMAEKLERYCAS
jgi:hypothetical protein